MMDNPQARAEGILARSAYPELRQIKVSQVDGHKIILEGIVKSFHMKQLAQEALLASMLDIQIENHLKVR